MGLNEKVRDMFYWRRRARAMGMRSAFTLPSRGANKGSIPRPLGRIWASNASSTNTSRLAARNLYWLASLTYDGYATDMDTLLNRLPSELAATYTHWRFALGAVNALTAGKLHAATAFADQALALDTHNTTNGIAMLVLARVASAEGLSGVARAYLRGISSLPGHGGHFVRAVAARELASLGVAS